MKKFGLDTDTDLVRALLTKAKFVYAEMEPDQAKDIAGFLNAAAERIRFLESQTITVDATEEDQKCLNSLD